MKQQKFIDQDDEATVETVWTADSSTVVSQPSPSQQCVRRKRRLRFSKTLQVTPVLHINDMTEEERTSIWYSQLDYDAIKNKIHPLVRKMNTGAQVEVSGKETSRGLEGRTREGSRRRKQNKYSSILSVIDEQERQLDAAENNPGLLAKVYKQATLSFQDDAYATGLKDQAAIQWELEKMRRKYGKSGGKNMRRSSPAVPSSPRSLVGMDVLSASVC